MALISGWGRFPVVDSDVLRPRSFGAVGTALAATSGGVARGNGRAYGDAGIGLSQTITMTAFDRIRSFDPATGRIRLEAGVLLLGWQPGDLDGPPPPGVDPCPDRDPTGDPGHLGDRGGRIGHEGDHQLRECQVEQPEAEAIVLVGDQSRQPARFHHP